MPTAPATTRSFNMIQTMQIPEARHGSPWFLAAAMTGVLTLAACASTPAAPTAALQAAEQAIAHAEQQRVADYASLELGEAREKLTAARAAVQHEQMVLAGRLADESRVSAELASARAEAARAEEVNDEMRKSTETLKHEMQRNHPGVR
jgi:hypothetical protein